MPILHTGEASVDAVAAKLNISRRSVASGERRFAGRPVVR
jgi:hypothetical protein